MILGGNKMYEAFTQWWQAYRNGELMTKDELFDAIGSNSIDVTLASAIMVQRSLISKSESGYRGLDPYEKSNYYIAQSMEEYLLSPCEFILGVTQERFVTDEPLTLGVVDIPNSPVFGNVETRFIQKYDGRSTMGRLGIASHVTAGFGDYGFKDYWTLEIVNLGQVPVVLHAGMRIGQISFEAVYDPSVYEGAYTDVSKMPKPKAPKLGKDRF